MAMKPLDGTFKKNAAKWGQGGINIDGCRIGMEGATKRSEQSEYPKNEDGTENRNEHWARTGHSIEKVPKGRWPANVILDEEAVEMLGNPSRFFYCAKASSRERNEGLEGLPDIRGGTERMNNSDGRKKELGESNRLTLTKNNHPTVKPLSLMKYLITLVMPPKGGILLDPFAGSGTTILAAQQLDFDAIGIEKSPEYVEIARARLEHKEITYEDDLISLSMSM